MKKAVFITLLFLVLGLTANGQDKTITEFDLYGCWIWERSENLYKTENQIYKRCEKSDSKRAVRGSEFSLLAYNKSEVQNTGPICPIYHTENGTWHYDKTDSIVQIYFAQEWLKKLKELDPEKYVEWNSPEKLTWLKFKIIKLNKNQLEIKKLRTTRPIANRDER